ncbi:hypothetical protein MNBD_ALPHA04-933, partial [hydrothermal vent metagenome]
MTNFGNSDIVTILQTAMAPA